MNRIGLVATALGIALAACSDTAGPPDVKEPPTTPPPMTEPDTVNPTVTTVVLGQGDSARVRIAVDVADPQGAGTILRLSMLSIAPRSQELHWNVRPESESDVAARYVFHADSGVTSVVVQVTDAEGHIVHYRCAAPAWSCSLTDAMFPTVPGVAGIRVDATEYRVVPGDSLVITATAVDAAGAVMPGTPLTFHTMQGSVAVDSLGRVRVLGIGDGIVFIRSGYVQQTVYFQSVALMTRLDLELTSLRPGEPHVIEGGSGELVATPRDSAGNRAPYVRRSDGRIIDVYQTDWTIGDTTVAVLVRDPADHAKVRVNYRAAGETFIRATQAAVTDSFPLRVFPRLRLEHDYIVIGSGETVSVGTTVPVVWTSSDTSVVRVDEAGRLTGGQVGWKSVEAKTTEGAPQTATLWVLTGEAGTAPLKDGAACSAYWMPRVTGEWRLGQLGLTFAPDRVTYDWPLLNPGGSVTIYQAVGPAVWSWSRSSGCSVSVTWSDEHASLTYLIAPVSLTGDALLIAENGRLEGTYTAVR